MLLQSLTTRVPDDAQIEVAIHAMNTALAADEGRQPVAQEGAEVASPSESNPVEGEEAFQ